MKPAAHLDFGRAFNRVERYVEGRWGIPVILTDVVDPNTGDFDGVSISVDWQVEDDVALFVLAHLFGHTVQWSIDERARDVGTRYGSAAPPLEDFEVVRLYEEEASRYALQLFYDAGLEGFDAWLSDWAAADWRFLERFYRTGERTDFRRYLEPGTPLLQPLPIPHFQPERWVSRFSF